MRRFFYFHVFFTFVKFVSLCNSVLYRRWNFIGILGIAMRILHLTSPSPYLCTRQPVRLTGATVAEAILHGRGDRQAGTVWEKYLGMRCVFQMKETTINNAAPTQDGAVQTTGEPRFSWFTAPARSVRPAGQMTVWEAYRLITTDVDTLQATHRLRALDPVEQKEERRKLKQTLFSFATFSGTFAYRRRQDLLRHSQLLCIDLDHVGEPCDVMPLKLRLAADPEFETALCFQSPSGDGVKWVVCIGTEQATHEEWFDATCMYLRDAYGLEADKACRDVTRCCFLPHDGLALIGEQFRKCSNNQPKKGEIYENIPF